MIKTILKDTLSLVVITVVAGFLLAFVYGLTENTIAAAEADERAASYREVFPDAENFEAVESYNMPEIPAGVGIGEVLYATDADGGIIGCVVSATSANGYGGDITLSVGVDMSGKITGVKVTSMSETSGLGSHCQDEDFQAQFKGITGPVEFTKTGKTKPNEIDAISGATVTTTAVTEAVNGAIGIASVLLGGDGQ